MKSVGWPLTVVAAVLVTLAAVANAQEQKKLPRIGYIDGQNIRIEYRYGEGS